MKRQNALFAAVLSGALTGCALVPAKPPEPRTEFPMREGIKIMADGEPISVRIGHLVPCALDWNDDDKKDLVVGQFMGGSIRVYLNEGTDVAPEFGDFSYLDAGAQEIHLPAG